MGGSNLDAQALPQGGEYISTSLSTTTATSAAGRGGAQDLLRGGSTFPHHYPRRHQQNSRQAGVQKQRSLPLPQDLRRNTQDGQGEHLENANTYRRNSSDFTQQSNLSVTLGSLTESTGHTQQLSERGNIMEEKV
ncbi:hypothetical protein M758_UG292000 [Ceratodon purpureus]|nr:hypothetical protein M758_UG292000 [Ceratodon purpureus]